MNGVLPKLALSLGLLAAAIGSAQARNEQPEASATSEPAQAAQAVQATPTLTMRPDSLLAVDRNRAAVIERIITQFRESFAPGQDKMVRETLQSLRADHLLAASLAPSLDGLVAAIKAADTGIAAAPISPKLLGDPTADLVYTPRVPCRLFDSRGSQGGLGPLTPGVTRTYSVTAPVIQQGGPGGCTAPAGTAVAFIQIAALTPQGQGLVQGGATGTGPFANALVLYQPGGLDGAGVPMPVRVADGRFDLVAQFNGVEVAGDLLGYFIEPQATPLECNNINQHGPGNIIPNGGVVTLAIQGCAAGFTRTGAGCHSDFQEGALISVSPFGIGTCEWRNNTGGNVNDSLFSAETMCCRVPGR